MVVQFLTSARRRGRRSVLRAAGVALFALALAGCGLAIGSGSGPVQLLVTRDFGARVLQHTGGLHARGGETVLSVLAGTDAVRSRSPEGRMVSIDGLSATGRQGAAAANVQWVDYVNGVQAAKPPARTKVFPGDEVWWDLHDVTQSSSLPAAIVGAFPQPFLDGIEGRRLPVRVECTAVAGDACSAVTAVLRRSGVPAAVTAVGSGGAPETLRVIVGPWERIDSDLEAQTIADGPGASGVYARFADGGRELALLDAQGLTVRTLTAGTGIVAATQGAKEAPVWVVSGTDAAGVELAARAFNRSTLEDRFAVAVQAAGTTPLPVPNVPAR